MNDYTHSNTHSQINDASHARTHASENQLDTTHPPGREEDGAGDYVPGLSMEHNSTLSNITFWAGGQLVRCQRNKLAGVGAGPGGIRGKIKGLSKNSRRRLMQKMAKVDKEELPLFVTLTFPDQFYNDRLDVKEVKRILKRFRSRLERRYSGVGGFWKMETASRKSGMYVGEVFIHFHLLLWGVKDVISFRSWVARSWYEVCGELSEAHLLAGTSVEKVRSYKGAMFYASKYIAKEGQYDFETGRVWGEIAIENIPFVRSITVRLTEREAVCMLRYMRRFARMRGRDYHSLTLFMDAEFWLNNLDRMLYPE